MLPSATVAGLALLAIETSDEPLATVTVAVAVLLFGLPSGRVELTWNAPVIDPL